MTQETVDTINIQATAEGRPKGIIFSDIKKETTINDLDVSPDKDNTELNDDDADDKSYLTSNDLTV